jgi:hypothetical protein
LAREPSPNCLLAARVNKSAPDDGPRANRTYNQAALQSLRADAAQFNLQSACLLAKFPNSRSVPFSLLYAHGEMYEPRSGT